MKAERLQKVSPIFHQVVELPPDERAAFLASACAGDATLREDVESLLSAHERAGSFIESPAYEEAAVLLTDGSTGPVEGQLIEHYKIVALLGKGGRPASAMAPPSCDSRTPPWLAGTSRPTNDVGGTKRLCSGSSSSAGTRTWTQRF